MTHFPTSVGISLAFNFKSFPFWVIEIIKFLEDQNRFLLKQNENKRILIEKVDSKLDKVDWIIIFIVCFLYGLLSFYKLGTTKSPQTFIFSDYSYEVYNFKISGDTSNTNKIKYFVGPREGSFKVLASKDNKSYHLVYSSESEESVLNWKEAKISDIKNMKYIQVIADSDDVSLGEISFNGNITLIGLDDESKKLIDEQNTVPSKIDYYNSAYFDEVYYARTAYEYVHGIGVFGIMMVSLSTMSAQPLRQVSKQ